MSRPSQKGQPRKKGGVMSEARFARLWRDPTVSVQVIGDMLGISRAAVGNRARTRGLPPRKGTGNTARIRIEDSAPELAAMWLAGVGMNAMTAHFGCSHTGIIKAVERMGLPKRETTRWNALTVADCRALQLRSALAASARETRAAMHLSEMVDGIRLNRRLAA